MQKTRPVLFRRRHFQDHVIVLCVRWYLRYCLTLRDLEELMAERGLGVDHSTIGRWVLRYAPSFTNEFVGTPALQTDPGESTKCASAWPDGGPIYIGRSTPAVKPLISCSLLSGMRWLSSMFCRWRCGEWEGGGRG